MAGLGLTYFGPNGAIKYEGLGWYKANSGDTILILPSDEFDNTLHVSVWRNRDPRALMRAIVNLV